MQLADNITAILQLILAVSVASILCNVTLWGIASKYRLLERYEAKKRVKMPNPCILCITFWVSFAYIIPVAAKTGRWEALLAAFLSAGYSVKIAFQR